MPFIWRVCLRVRGSVANLTMMVNTTMDSQNWSKNTTYNSARLLIIGSMMKRLKPSPIGPMASNGLSFGSVQRPEIFQLRSP